MTHSDMPDPDSVRPDETPASDTTEPTDEDGVVREDPEDVDHDGQQA